MLGTTVLSDRDFLPRIDFVSFDLYSQSVLSLSGPLDQ